MAYSVTGQVRKSQKKSWLTYGAASSVALLAASGVEATIVYSGLQNIPINVGANTFIDIDNDGAGDLNFTNFFTGVSFSVTGQNGALIQSDGI